MIAKELKADFFEPVLVAIWAWLELVDLLGPSEIGLIGLTSSRGGLLPEGYYLGTPISIFESIQLIDITNYILEHLLGLQECTLLS